MISAAHLNRFYRALLTGQLLNRALLAEMQTTCRSNRPCPRPAGMDWASSWLGSCWLATAVASVADAAPALHLRRPSG